jgi:hypothetical protein
MESLAERAEARLFDVIGRFTAGEAEVVETFFAQEHSTEEHFEVLLRQIGRELQTRQRLANAVAMNAGLERTVDRHAFVDMLDHIADELKHYMLVADLAEWLIGRELTPEEAFKYEVSASADPAVPPELLQHPLLPEASAMVMLIRQARETHGTDFANAVVRLSEGGGGGAFEVAAALSGDEYRERLAAVMRTIVKDELGHGPGRVHGFVEKWIKDEATLERAEALLTEYMWQHMRVRNEIWCNPLSEERMAAIRRGEITPRRIDLAAASA